MKFVSRSSRVETGYGADGLAFKIGGKRPQILWPHANVAVGNHDDVAVGYHAVLCKVRDLGIA